MWLVSRGCYTTVHERVVGIVDNTIIQTEARGGAIVTRIRDRRRGRKKIDVSNLVAEVIVYLWAWFPETTPIGVYRGKTAPPKGAERPVGWRGKMYHIPNMEGKQKRIKQIRINMICCLM